MRDISLTLNQHYQKVLEYGISEDQILGIFVYGSQNYNLSIDSSDVDTKCIYIPTISQALFKNAETKELHLENDEHCEVMPIQHFVQNLYKQNINFMEILFTSNYILNVDYEDLWKEYFIDKRERIAHYDENKCIQSICGQAIHTLKRRPLDGKQLGNGTRLKRFLDMYLQGFDYLSCIQPTGHFRDAILAVKGKVLESTAPAEYLIKEFGKLKNRECNRSVDKDLVFILQEGAERMVRRLDDTRRD